MGQKSVEGHVWARGGACQLMTGDSQLHTWLTRSPLLNAVLLVLSPLYHFRVCALVGTIVFEGQCCVPCVGEATLCFIVWWLQNMPQTNPVLRSISLQSMSGALVFLFLVADGVGHFHFVR